MIYLTDDELKTFADNGVNTDAIRNTINTYRAEGWTDDAIRRKIDDKLTTYKTTGLNETQLRARADLDNSINDISKRSAPSKPSEKAQRYEEEFFNNFFKKAAQQKREDEAREQMGSLFHAMRTSGERVLNSATLGAYGTLNDTMGGNFDERNKVGQENIRKAGWGGKAFNTASNLINDVAAGIPAGAGAYAATGKVAKIAKRPLLRTTLTGAGLGGASGFFNARGSIGDRAGSGAAAAIVGAALAPVAYAAERGIGKVADKVSNYMAKRRVGIVNPDTKAMKTLSRAVGGDDKLDDLIAQAQRDGVPLIDTGDINLEQAARTARTVSPEANRRMDKYFQDQSNNAPSRANNMVDDFFGKKNSIQNAEELAAELDPEANTLYEIAFAGNTKVVPGSMKTYTAPAKLPTTEFKRLDADPYIRDAIDSAPSIHKELQVAGRKAVKDAAGNITYEKAPAARNDMRRLDFAKEVLDNQINRELASPAPNTRLVASLSNAKNKLVAAMDAYSPAYKSARSVSGKKLSALEAQKFGAKIDRADVSADTFIKRISQMTDTEKAAVRVGARDYYKKGFEQSANPAKFAKRLLDTDAQKKLRALLGDEEATALIAQARNMVNRMNAKNFIMGGSRTAENLQAAQETVGTASKFAAHPISTTVEKIANLWDKHVATNKYAQIADILLRDPTKITRPTATPISDITKKTSPILAAVLAGTAAGNDAAESIKNARDIREEMNMARLGLNKYGLSGKEYDRYFHNKAQYKNAQRGLLGFLTSQTAGALAEANDAARNLRRHPLSVVAADMLQDLTYNKNGGIHGLTDDTPADSNEYLESQKTKHLRLLEQILRGGNK